MTKNSQTAYKLDKGLQEEEEKGEDEEEKKEVVIVVEVETE